MSALVRSLARWYQNSVGHELTKYGAFLKHHRPAAIPDGRALRNLGRGWLWGDPGLGQVTRRRQPAGLSTGISQHSLCAKDT